MRRDTENLVPITSWSVVACQLVRVFGKLGTLMSPVSNATNQGSIKGGPSLVFDTDNSRSVIDDDAGLVDDFLKKQLALVADFGVEHLRLLDPTSGL
jgi:hypothetical protein